MRSTKKTIIWTRAGFIKFSGLRQGYIYILLGEIFFSKEQEVRGGGENRFF